MAKKKVSRPRTVDQLRREIDKLDREMITLVNRRAKYALDIGKIKDDTGQPVYAPDREEAVLLKAASTNKGPLPEKTIRAIFREIISGARGLEKHLRVSFLGPAFSYTHMATISRFGQSAELVPVSTIATVFEEVNRGHVDLGVVPLENSTDGRIADTLEMFTRLPVRICGEVQMYIHHCLLARCDRSEIKEVYSKPQALSQCRNWLSKNLPGYRLIEVTSTSTAAQLAHDKPGAAAIASHQAGVNYSLETLVENIEDNTANITRFAVIGKNSGKRTGRDKTSLMFEVAHQPGSLADTMAIFKRNRLNLTWIESFPIPGTQGAYLFFVELEGHESDAKVKKAVASLERKATRLEILGSYARSTPCE